MNHTCAANCGQPIPAGQAVLRSTDPFGKPTAYHRGCWELRQAVAAAFPAPTLPVQRPSATLAERLAAARQA